MILMLRFPLFFLFVCVFQINFDFTHSARHHTKSLFPSKLANKEAIKTNENPSFLTRAQNFIQSALNYHHNDRKDIKQFQSPSISSISDISDLSSNWQEVYIPQSHRQDHVVAPIGLINNANECFMISVIQSLYYSTLFRETILNNQDLFDMDTHPILYSIRILFQEIQLSKKPFRPKGFYRALRIKFIRLQNQNGKPLSLNDFFDSVQHDAHEFFIFLIDVIKTEESTLPITPISDLFNGQTILKKQNGEFGPFPEPFTILSLFINESIDLHSSFVKTFESEIEMKPNGKSQNELIKCVLKFHNIPKILVIQLQRYDQDELKKFIGFPMIFKLLPQFMDDFRIVHRYKLVSVIQHIGESLESGHYITDALADSGWMRFDDEYVEVIGIDTLESDIASILIYEIIE